MKRRGKEKKESYERRGKKDERNGYDGHGMGSREEKEKGRREGGRKEGKGKGGIKEGGR